MNYIDTNLSENFEDVNNKIKINDTIDTIIDQEKTEIQENKKDELKKTARELELEAIVASQVKSISSTSFQINDTENNVEIFKPRKLDSKFKNEEKDQPYSDENIASREAAAAKEEAEKLSPETVAILDKADEMAMWDEGRIAAEKGHIAKMLGCTKGTLAEAIKAAKKKITPPKESKGTSIKCDGIPRDSSIELHFTHSIITSQPVDKQDLRRDKHSKKIYLWENEIYNFFDNCLGIQYAQQWLRDHHPDQYSDGKAVSCWNTAINEISWLPNKTKRHIIAFENCWLELNENHEFIRIQPDRNIYIQHRFNAKLDLGNTQIGEVWNLPKIDYSKTVWGQFISSSIPNEENQLILQEFCGYTLIPATQYQLFLGCFGEGANGKGIFQNALGKLHPNTVSIPIHEIGGFGLEQLPDASLISITEIPSKIVTPLVKNIVSSDDPIFINPKYEKGYTATIQAKLIISGNKLPTWGDHSAAIYRRLIYIEWGQSFIGREDHLLGQKLENELNVIAYWSLAGLQRLCMRGRFEKPKSMLMALDQMRTDANNVWQFLQEQEYTIEGKETSTLKNKVYSDYCTFCNEGGTKPFNEVGFWKHAHTYFQKTAVGKELIEERKSIYGTRHKYVNIKSGLNKTPEF